MIVEPGDRQRSLQKAEAFALAKFDKHIYPSVHRGIVRAALQVLEEEEHPAAKRFSAGDAEALIEEAAAPDKIGDRQQGRGLHYYNAVRPDGKALPFHPALCGYCNGKGAPAPSPLTMLDAEYRTALALYRAGKYYPAMKSLSRAMHMLADICCPPHCCDLSYFSRYAVAHKRYESRAAVMFWNSSPAQLSEYNSALEWAKQAVGTVPYDTYTDLLRGSTPVSRGTWQSGTFAEICNQLALSGAMELSAVLGDDEIARDASVTKRLLLAIAHCAALLAAFDRDVQDDSLNIWQEKHPYWLKSFGTAFVATEDPLYLSFEEDGSCTLSTLEGQYLAVGKMGRVLLSDSQSDLVTRFRFGREPLLTLYPDGDQKHLLAQIRGQLHCIRRVSHLQGNLFLSQVSFALVNQPPENAKPMLR